MPGKSDDHVAQLQKQISTLRARVATLEDQRAEHERAEAALTQSEQQLKDILDNTTAVIYVKDAGGRYLLVNRVYEALFHTTRDQCVGKTDHDLFPKERADAYRSNDRRVLEADAPIEFEELVSLDDGLHTYLSVKFPLRDAAGKSYAVCGISTDITERKRAEEAIRESETKFRESANTVAAATFIFQGRRLVYTNPAAEIITGYSQDELVGAEFLKVIHPEYRDLVRQRGLARLRGETVPDSYEVKLLTKDGRERWVDFTAAVIKYKGEPAVLGTAFDITDRKNAEAHVRNAERHLRMVLDHVGPHIMVGLMTPDGILIEANQPGLGIAGLEPHDVLGKPCEEAYWFSYSDSNKQRLREVIRRAANGETIRYDMDLRVAEDRFISIDFSLRPLIDEEGRITHLVPSATDITERKRAMEELRESELRYRRLVETIPHGIQRITKSGIVTFSNPASDAMLEYEPGELIGKAVWDLHADDDAKKELKAYLAQLVRDQPPPSPYFTQNVTKHGRRIDVRVDWNYERHEHGEVTGFISVISDITERNRAEAALRESEERLRQVTENIREVFWLHDCRSDKIVYVSPAYEKVWGRGTHHLYDDPADWSAAIVPDDRQRVASSFEKQLRGEVEQYEEEYRITRPDGTIRWIHDRGFPVLDEKGRVQRIAGLAEDITERKQVEEALRNTEARQALILSSLPMALYTADLSGSFGSTWVSEQIEHLSGFPPEHWLADPELWPSRLHPEDRQRALEEYGALHTQDEVSVEYRWRCADGTYRWFLDRAVLVRDGSGEPKEAIGTWLDITERKRAEKTLHDSEEKHRGLFEQAADSIVIIDHKRRAFSEFNDKAHENLGYTREEFRNLTLADIEVVESAEEVAAHIQKILDEGADTFETQHRTKNGEIRDVLVNAKVIWIHGRVYFQSSWRDITERKRAEKALEESERRYRAIVEDQTEFICRLLPDGTHTFVNDAYCVCFGKSREELMGQDFMPLVPETEHEHVRRHFAALSPKTPMKSIEHRVLAANGELCWHEWTNRAFFDQSGNVVEYQSVGRNITERKRAEERLQRSEEQYRSVVDNVGVGIAVISPKMEILTLNNQMKKWFPDIQVSKKPICYEAYNDPPRESACSYCPTVKTLKDGQTHQAITETPAGNETRHYKIISTALRGKGDEVTAAIEMVEDITERTRAEKMRADLEDQLRHAQKMEAVGTLASGIAHDFSNLLTAIFGYTDLGKTTLADDHPAVRALQMVEESARQARGVTNALLTFSHKKIAEKQPIDLGKTVRSTTRLLRRVLPASIEIIEDLPQEQEVWANADATQFQQILMNLAVNARDAMPERGRLRIGLTRETARNAASDTAGASTETDTALLLVEDNGAGMSEDITSRAFEPFFTTKPRGQGTGLGLSVILGIVTDHNGQIEIDSEPGKGTRVSIRLPCCPPQAPVQTPAAGRRTTTGQGEVLIVLEDDEHVRSIMTSALRSRGYHVLPATDGAEAAGLLVAHVEAVRLIVLDLDLPRTDGWVALQQALQRRKDVAIVAITAGMDSNHIDKVDRVKRLLRKPFQVADLIAQVGESLAASANKESP